MSENNNVTLDPSTLLDMNLDAFKDAPEFTNPPAGAYAVVLSAMETKDLGGKNAICVKATVVETLQLNDATEEAPAQGTELEAVFFIFDYEMAQGHFKALTLPLAEALGVATLRELMEAVDGFECTAVTGLRANKKTEKVYFEFKEFLID